MKLAIASDIHLGDPECVMVDVDPSADTGWKLNPYYEKFREAVGDGNRYLILIGDIFDLSIANYTEAYGAAKTFLRAVNRDGLAEEIIYIAGNHDFSVYRTFVRQRNVINRIRRGKLPTTFWTVPGVLDDSSDLPIVIVDTFGDSIPGRGDVFGDAFIGILEPGDPRLCDVPVLAENRLDLRRGDVLTARDDEIRPPIEHAELARGIEHPHIAGVEPAVAKRAGGFLGVVEIAGHHRRPAHQDLSLPPGRKGAPAVVGDSDLGSEERASHAPRLLESVPGIGGGARRHLGAGLGEAVAGQHSESELARAPFGIVTTSGSA